MKCPSVASSGLGDTKSQKLLPIWLFNFKLRSSRLFPLKWYFEIDPIMNKPSALILSVNILSVTAKLWDDDPKWFIEIELLNVGALHTFTVQTYAISLPDISNCGTIFIIEHSSE